MGMKIIDDIKDLLVKDDLEKALNSLKVLAENSPKLNETIIQSARYSEISNAFRIGIVSFEEAGVYKNRIRASVLELLDEIQKEAMDDVEVRKELLHFASLSESNYFQLLLNKIWNFFITFWLILSFKKIQAYAPDKTIYYIRFNERKLGFFSYLMISLVLGTLLIFLYSRAVDGNQNLAEARFIGRFLFEVVGHLTFWSFGTLLIFFIFYIENLFSSQPRDNIRNLPFIIFRVFATYFFLGHFLMVALFPFVKLHEVITGEENAIEVGNMIFRFSMLIYLFMQIIFLSIYNSYYIITIFKKQKLFSKFLVILINVILGLSLTLYNAMATYFIALIGFGG